ncbi:MULTISPECIES: 50S ribosomal protein L29 [Methanofollis]|jgi:large subunit ribosomal protein L29|uniref:Large ribosomal subunit protein uL29 n=3 Tax=Methanofollis TaxID=81416 RepID=A0A7K4HNL3_9EURY|nr:MULTISPECIES: 50S ribosomal protein L29 [Methanofollis]EJG06420.1 ribosomal protein L29 [Methanofollis liminatans DSM 4140]NVO66637.1 50S ribosomal protein L29 [Methanofollis tationis]HDS63881.1 50S ribosomal protein L29 [Methanofollis liminatans]
MAIFRAHEVRQLSDVELGEQLQKLKLDLMQSRGKVSAGGAPENPGHIRVVRRTIARIITEQNARRTKQA